MFVDGSAGGETLAREVVRVADSGSSKFAPLYKLDRPIREKIETLATCVYGAAEVAFEPSALSQMERFEAQGYGELPICLAKTQYSLSHDAKLKGRPTGYSLPIREVRLYAGAGFLVPLAGNIMTMPGLGRNPAYRGIDMDADGNISGLF